MDNQKYRYATSGARYMAKKTKAAKGSALSPQGQTETPPKIVMERKRKLSIDPASSCASEELELAAMESLSKGAQSQSLGQISGQSQLLSLENEDTEDAYEAYGIKLL